SSIAILCVLLTTAASCGSSSKKPKTSAIAWPAPADPMARARGAGLVPETAESFVLHVHAHLDVLVNGQAVTVPAGIGINIHDPAVHTGEVSGAKAYGSINPPCHTACISPLHTHDVTGILHTESPNLVRNKLGELF